jgi:hypothetical protein
MKGAKAIEDGSALWYRRDKSRLRDDNRVREMIGASVDR